MSRHRRHNRRQSRPQTPRKLDQPVMMAAYSQDTPDWEKWRSRTVSLRHCLEMVAAGEAKEIVRQGKNGLVAFFQETNPTRASESSPTTLTMATMNAVARSDEQLTAGEKAHVLKFRVWGLIGDTKAVAVRPRLSDAEHKLAVSLLSGKAA